MTPFHCTQTEESDTQKEEYSDQIIAESNKVDALKRFGQFRELCDQLWVAGVMAVLHKATARGHRNLLMHGQMMQTITVPYELSTVRHWTPYTQWTCHRAGITAVSMRACRINKQRSVHRHYPNGFKRISR